MIPEHDQVILTSDLPEFGLKAGDIGTIVHVYRDAAYEVEFVTLDGRTVAVVTLEKDQVRPVGAYEMHHSRPMEKRA
jgi:hypothetical protein